MESIKDRVAIVGMGCCKFGERWDTGTEDLLVESTSEASLRISRLHGWVPRTRCQGRSWHMP